MTRPNRHAPGTPQAVGLVWRAVPKVVLASVRHTAEVEDHILDKHPPLTARKVTQALIYAKDVEANWEDHPVHGHQVVAFGTTIDGIAFKAYLHPVNPNDPDEGTFDLNTAFPLLTESQGN
jgi:uncharacterized protein (DUF433 family)